MYLSSSLVSASLHIQGRFDGTITYYIVLFWLYPIYVLVLDKLFYPAHVLSLPLLVLGKVELRELIRC